MSMHRSIVTVAAGLAACGALVAGCGGVSAGRAGEQPRPAPLTLTFAQPNDGTPPEQLVRWADEVERLSAGSLAIEFENGWRLGEVDFEAGTLADVGDGEIDLAWVGARVFDTVGVDSFQALVAPMLVDSHDLQAAVFEAGIPEQMLDGIDGLDIIGIGVLPGPMRKLLAKDHAYVTPEDFPDDVIGLQASGVAEKTFTALGATPTRLPSGADISTVDGYEQQLASIWGNHYEQEAEFVTANVNLWPRPLVIVANVDVFESLESDQQEALRQASAHAATEALEASREEDTSGAESLCDAGMTFTTASTDDLEALRSALAPVYSSLEADPATAEFLDAIAGLKQRVGAPPDTPTCAPAGVSDSTTEADDEAAIPNGTYATTLTGADILSSGCDPQNFPWQAPDDEIAFELTLGDGQLEQFESVNGDDPEPGWVGTYTVFRDQIEIQGDYSIDARWTFDGTNLVLSDVETPNCADAVIWTTHPWVLVEPAD
jgi:TRAP-type C4-dicarboxylate transport system substrate-binding protein